MKQKSHSGAKKRTKKTGTGKYMVQKSSQNHLLTNKSKRQKKIGTKVTKDPQQKMLEKLLS